MSKNKQQDKQRQERREDKHAVAAILVKMPEIWTDAPVR
jgi:hypothetical protein